MFLRWVALCHNSYLWRVKLILICGSKWTCRPDLWQNTLLRGQWRLMQCSIFAFSSASLPPPLFSSLQLTWVRRTECIHTWGFTQNAQNITVHIPVLCSDVHTRLEITCISGLGTTCVLESGRDLIQATELQILILIGVLCSPRACSVLMCAASWTAVTQPQWLHILSKSKASRFLLGSLINTQELHEERENKLHYLFKGSNLLNIHEEY